jgi:hypothetical protein
MPWCRRRTPSCAACASCRRPPSASSSPTARPASTVYWAPTFETLPEERGLSFEDWQDRVLGALRTAVDRRLVADVDVGVLLSGGLDSSLIVGLLAEQGQTGLNTFSVGFESVGDEAGDEFQYSDIIAKHYGTTHHKIHVDSASRLLPNLPGCIRHGRADGQPRRHRLLSALAGGGQARQGGAERAGRRRGLRRLPLVSADAAASTRRPRTMPASSATATITSTCARCIRACTATTTAAPSSASTSRCRGRGGGGQGAAHRSADHAGR